MHTRLQRHQDEAVTDYKTAYEYAREEHREHKNAEEDIPQRDDKEEKSND